MIYEFQLVGGSEKIERYYRADDAPAIGETILVGEKLYRRIISAGTEVDVKNLAHVSRSLPMGAKHAPHYDAHGRPAFQSNREVREFAAKTGMHWD